MFRALARVFRGLLVASAFFFFWTGAVTLAWTLCPVLNLVVRDRVRRWRTCQRVLKRAFWLFHGYMRVLTLLEMRVLPSAADARKGRPSGPLVVIANHPTLVDVTAILASFDDVCCVVKSSLIHDAFVGPLLRACGHIDGGSGEIMSGAVIMQEAQERLDAGFAVLIFPEGTRSPPWGLHPFRRGAFELAARARVAIWPLFVTCNPPALSKGVPFWRQPGRVARLRIQPGELIPAHASARAARSAVEALFRAHRALQPASPEPAPRQCVKAVAPTAAACAIEPFAETPREGVSTKPA